MGSARYGAVVRGHDRTRGSDVGRLLDDAIELVEWVRSAFECDKVHLLGHSWGGCLALLLARHHAGAVASVYALCPFIDLHRSAAVAYRELVARAQDRDDDAAVTELRELEPPPYADLTSAMKVHTKWIIEYGGMVRGGPEQAAQLFGLFENVAGYSPSDYVNAAKGQRFSGEHLIEECATLDLAELVQRLDVPLTVGVGRHDLVNATEVSLAWFDGVNAPAKRLHVFEDSAHFPNVSEAKLFAASVLDSMR